MNLRVAVTMTLTVIQINPNREEPRSLTPGAIVATSTASTLKLG